VARKVYVLRTFIEAPAFTLRWARAGYGDDDLKELQELLIDRPAAGPLLRETGGARKLRWAQTEGKSGGTRVVYYDWSDLGVIFLFFVFEKSEADNLSDKQKAEMKKRSKEAIKDLKARQSRRATRQFSIVK